MLFLCTVRKLTATFNFGESLLASATDAAPVAAIRLGLLRGGVFQLQQSQSDALTYLLARCIEVSLRVVLHFHVADHLLLLLLVDLLLQLDDACLDPRVLEGLLGCHALLHLPAEALVDEVDKHVVVTLEHLGQVLCVGSSNFALRVGILQRPVVVVEEDFPSRGHDDHGARRQTLDLHDALDLLLLVLTGENGEAYVQFVEDAPERPHINGGRISDAHHDLGSTVEARLDVSVELVSLISARSKVNHLDATLVGLSQQDILGLHVAVNNVVFAHVMERDEQLDGEAAHQSDGDTLEVVALDELVQVHRQHFERENQMLAEHELLSDADDVLFVLRVSVAQLVEDLGLNETLLVEALLVTQDLQGGDFFLLMIISLEHLAKATLAEATSDFEAVGYVLALVRDVLVLVIIKTIVVDAVGSGWWALLPLTLLQGEPVDGLEVEDLRLLDVHQVLAEVDDRVPRVHREDAVLLLAVQ